MKTQLLQDIDDSGAAPSALDGRRRLPGAAPARGRLAVWHRAPPAARLQPEHPASVPDAAPESSADPTPDTPPDFTKLNEPDWLAELMRQDAERAEARQRSLRRRRHLLGWTAAAGVVALAAATGLWLAEERRVDGALVVVAGTQPPPAARVPEPAPAQPVTAPPKLAAPTFEEPAQPAAAPAARTPAPEAGNERVVPTVPTIKASRPGVEASPGQAERRKREETLLQCRALGYDEAQCIRRACAMTRFGLACRGGVVGQDTLNENDVVPADAGTHAEDRN